MSGRFSMKKYGLIFFLLLAVSGGGAVDTSGNKSLSAQVTIDLAALREGVPAMTGLLNSTGMATSDQVLDNLAPRFLRGDLSLFLVDPRIKTAQRRWDVADLERVHARGIQWIFMMDTTWGHPVDLQRFPEKVFPDGSPMWLCA